MVSDYRARAVGAGDPELHLSRAAPLRVLHRADMDRDVSHDLVLQVPASGRPERRSHQMRARRRGEMPEQHRRFGAEQEPPAGPQPGRRPPNSTPQRAVLHGWNPDEGRAPCDDAYLRARLMVKQGGKVKGGGAPADHGDVPRPELREVVMIRAVRHPLRG